MARSLAKFSVASKQQSGQRTGAGKIEMAKQRDREVFGGARRRSAVNGAIEPFGLAPDEGAQGDVRSLRETRTSSNSLG